ncbi:hypothetical protein ASG49_13535 [Marmoricola sp. Leaf446]|uniref:hypothetical protein n=1 Tax=Marmoricola sp. Leaf446 TaxID=1736379 RepID=UPI0006F57595|nr:hypothetical protein [Marmoricola sp. Leaf446]KQT90764.1 hypothetical protein ASG49_13535 [Marmoricola sp. Leaf446]
MTDAEKLLAAVRANTEDTPYAVTETAKGFDVTIDVADATWFALMHQKHLSKSFTYHVVVDEANHTIAITDDLREVTWRRGAEMRDGIPVPVLGASLSRDLGRIEQKSFQKTFGIDSSGQPGKVVDYSFSSSEGRDLIRGPARELGWTEKRGGAERIGLAVAVGTVALLVLAGIIVAVVALAGGF